MVGTGRKGHPSGVNWGANEGFKKSVPDGGTGKGAERRVRDAATWACGWKTVARSEEGDNKSKRKNPTRQNGGHETPKNIGY